MGDLDKKRKIRARITPVMSLYEKVCDSKTCTKNALIRFEMPLRGEQGRLGISAFPLS